MKIIVDAMGGDHAPEAAVIGAAEAAGAFGEEIVLVGRQDVMEKILRQRGKQGAALTFVHAPDLVDMHDDPATVLRAKPQSSMSVALQMLKKGEGDAVVSAGNTGALLAGATLYGGRIKGIRRAALAPLMPCRGGRVMLVDAGANTECTAEYLLQFAFLGSLYMQKIQGIQNPRIGLVNNGTEDTKGDPLRRETFGLLKRAGDEGRLNFVGNVEGSGVAFGACDVAVCDGFSGNVMLKTLEGVAKFMGGEIKNVFTHNLVTKLGYLTCAKEMNAFQDQFNQDKVGGAPFLGISRPVIKAHGSSNETAFRSAIGQAIAYTKSGMIEAVRENIDHMTVDKSK